MTRCLTYIGDVVPKDVNLVMQWLSCMPNSLLFTGMSVRAWQTGGQKDWILSMVGVRTVVHINGSDSQWNYTSHVSSEWLLECNYAATPMASAIIGRAHMASSLVRKFMNMASFKPNELVFWRQTRFTWEPLLSVGAVSHDRFSLVGYPFQAKRRVLEGWYEETTS